MSSIHSQTSTAKGPSTVTKENEYEDAEKNFQQKSLKFWIIIIGVYLSIFLVALVSFDGELLRIGPYKSIGPNDYSYGYSQHNK